MKILNICLEMVYEILTNNLGHYTSDIKNGVPGWARTSGPLINSQML